MSPTVPNQPPEREPRHFANFYDKRTYCGLIRGEVYEADKRHDVTCPTCAAAYDRGNEDERQSARHLAEERRRQAYLDGDDSEADRLVADDRVSEAEAEAEGWTTTPSGHLDLMPEPLPAVDSWAAMTDAEMLERLRTAAITVDDIPADVRARMEVRIGDVFRQEGVTGDEARAGLARLRADATTDDAEILAAMLEPEPVHYDPDIMVRLSPCGLDLNELAREDVTTDPAKVTCPVCAASLVDGQLPPEPEETLQDQVGQLDAERESYRGLDGTEPADPRTLGLEIFTDELRELAIRLARSNVREEVTAAHVGLVFRVNGEARLVPDTDVPWTSTSLGPVKALRGLLTEMISGKNRLERQEGRPVDLLMPTPDVLAALAGTSVARYTAVLEMSYGTVPPGSYVRTEVEVAPGHRETVWQLLTGRRDCTDPDCTAVETGQPDCRVVTVEGRGEQHVARWWPVSARVPASTEVEQP